MSTTSTATAVNSCEHCEHCGQPTKQSTIPFGLTRVPISHSKDQRSSSWFEAPEFPTFELEYPDFTTFEDVEYDEPLVSKDDDKQVYPSGFRLATIVSALCLAVFCVALDNTIIATAIPQITSHFHNLEDAGWYGSAYLMTTCAFQLLFGKLYTLYSLKWTFMLSLFVFEIGSLICAAAPSSAVFIVGRAISGLGGSGVLCGSLVIISFSVPLEARPNFTGLIGGMFGVASVSGPLMGGALTDAVSWRWCFWINLPVGGVTAIILLIWLKIDVKNDYVPFGAKIAQLDIPGNTLFIASIICLLLALQWGGVTYAWSSWRIILLFVLFGLLLAAFVVVQVFMGEMATVPIRIARQRSIAFGSIFAFFIGAAFFLYVYYLPYYFQVIKAVSALQSGIDVLPLILAQVVGTIVAGALTSRMGYYMPFVYLSSVFMAVGGGLITLFEVDTSSAKWIGYQIIFGIGAGLGFQQVTLAAQAVLDQKDIAVGTGIAMFMQLFGGALFVSVGVNVFTNDLISNVIAAQVPGLDPAMIISAGATEVRRLIAPEFLQVILEAYNEALVETYKVGLITACLSIVGAFGMEWVNVKGRQLESVPV